MRATMNLRRIVLIVASSCWVLLFSERPAHAYIDPGSGSLLLQAILGGLAGLAVLVKMYWHRLTARFLDRSDGDESA